MAKYLLIESRDVFEYNDASYFCSMAKDLAANGNTVTLFLIQNGVLMARKTLQNSPVQPLTGVSGVSLLADDFSLRERAVPPGAVLPGVQVSNVDALVRLLAEDGIKPVWH